MKLWQAIKQLLDPMTGLQEQTFSLGNRGDQPAVEEQGPTQLKDAQERAGRVLTHIDNLLEAAPKGKAAVEKAGDLASSLTDNVERLKLLFRMPTNKDLIIREFTLASQPPTKAVVCYMEGLADKMIINDHILQPLMLLSHLDHHVDEAGESGQTAFRVDTVIKRLLPGHQVSEKYDMAGVAEALLSGDSVLFFEGAAVGIAVETKSVPARSISEPTMERVVYGAQDGFVEAFRLNVALVRRRLKDPRVVTEVLSVGKLSGSYVAVMYIDGIAAPKLVAEVRRRLEDIDIDLVIGGPYLEQYLEDSPGSLLPTMLTTERPDRVAAYLSEGHVAVLADNAPYALIAPMTFWSLLQTAEDYYLRFPQGTLLRYLRLLALVATLIVPASYVAVLNYHPEMIPTELMLFIAGSREAVPIPGVVEVLVMDVSFELIREGGTRIPGLIGPTVGLVASLVLGQAAVAAHIVSNVTILIVALTGLASFAIPSYMAAYGIRTLRFVLLIVAAVLGFYGIAAALFVWVIHLSAMRSFGVPYLSPVAPLRGGVADVLVRPQLFEMEMRPGYTHPLNRRRQKELVRKWDPFARQAVQNEQDGGGKGGGQP